MPKGNPAGYLPNMKGKKHKEAMAKKMKGKAGGKNPFAMAAQMKK